jgi:hypothetical protein
VLSGTVGAPLDFHTFVPPPGPFHVTHAELEVDYPYKSKSTTPYFTCVLVNMFLAKYIGQVMNCAQLYYMEVGTQALNFTVKGITGVDEDVGEMNLTRGVLTSSTLLKLSPKPGSSLMLEGAGVYMGRLEEYAHPSTISDSRAQLKLLVARAESVLQDLKQAISALA